MGLTSALDNLFGAFKKPAAKAVSQVKNLDSRVIKTGAAIGKNNKAVGAGAGVAKDVAQSTAKTSGGLAKVGSNVVSVAGSKPVLYSGLAVAGGVAGLKLYDYKKQIDAGTNITDQLLRQYDKETDLLRERMELIGDGAGPESGSSPVGSSLFSLGGATGTASPAGSGSSGSSGLVTFLVVGAVAGGGYLAYKAYKKRKK